MKHIVLPSAMNADLYWSVRYLSKYRAEPEQSALSGQTAQHCLLSEQVLVSRRYRAVSRVTVTRNAVSRRVTRHGNA